MLDQMNSGSDEEIEDLVMIYLEASRYLLNCHTYNESEMDNVLKILSTHKMGIPKPGVVAKMKEQASQIGYIRFKSYHSQILSGTVSNLLKILQNDYPGTRAEQFVRSVFEEIDLMTLNAKR